MSVLETAAVFLGSELCFKAEAVSFVCTESDLVIWEYKLELKSSPLGGTSD